MFSLLKPQPRRTTLARAPRARSRPRLEALDDRGLLSAGALDPTFGSGGCWLDLSQIGAGAR
jgi:hypothetical protein